MIWRRDEGRVLILLRLLLLLLLLLLTVLLLLLGMELRSIFTGRRRRPTIAYLVKLGDVIGIMLLLLILIVLRLR